MQIIKHVFVLACCIQLIACSVQKPIAKIAESTILSDSLLATAHVGICVYDATDNKYLYNYQGNKYFIPASNTKIATCYAAMKYLGDSLVGLRYQRMMNNGLRIIPTGDPSFLHPDFRTNPALDFLKKENGHINLSLGNWQESPLGEGWSWDDYNDDYMVERSAMPIYGNVVNFHLSIVLGENGGIETIPHYNFQSMPSFFQQKTFLSPKDDSSRIFIVGDTVGYFYPRNIKIKRRWNNNDFLIMPSQKPFKDVTIPFSTDEEGLVATLLVDTLHKKISVVEPSIYSALVPINSIHTIHSQPTDSLLKIMMHRSDNFYAEQSLLMVANEHIGIMNDAKIIDTLLKTDYAAMPQRPQWVDGSGLSRYNLFTPQDFVFILNKMRNEFSWERITTIFSTGDDGTLGSYYKGLKGKIFAKTGSLSNNIALSGYLITQKNKTLIFSVLVNNHTVSSTSVRKAVERFLTAVQLDN